MGLVVLEPGDLIVSLCPAEIAQSQSGVSFALWGGLLLESCADSRHPCRISGLHRRGLQAHHIEEVVLGDPEDFALYRLTPAERLTVGEQRNLEEHLRGWLQHNPLTHWVPSVIAIAALLMRIGKLPRANPAEYCASSLLARLAELEVYQHIGSPLSEASILPFPDAADAA